VGPKNTTTILQGGRHVREQRRGFFRGFGSRILRVLKAKKPDGVGLFALVP
jgi:hypothetical protein